MIPAPGNHPYPTFAGLTALAGLRDLSRGPAGSGHP
jgi:hypothetical protein